MENGLSLSLFPKNLLHNTSLSNPTSIHLLTYNSLDSQILSQKPLIFRIKFVSFDTALQRSAGTSALQPPGFDAGKKGFYNRLIFSVVMYAI